MKQKPKRPYHSVGNIQETYGDEDWLDTTSIEVDPLGRAVKTTSHDGSEAGYSWDTLDLTKPYNDLLAVGGQRFVWGDGLLMSEGSECFSYLTDYLGSPIRLVGGEHQETLAYDEFGVPAVGPGMGARSFHNPFGFTGYQPDGISGLQYAQARYYAPALGRFGAENTHWGVNNRICGDKLIKIGTAIVPNIYAIMQSSNLYTYTINNPLRWIDPVGMIIRISPDATEDEQQAYDRAIEYLMQSETFMELWTNLAEDQNIIFTIKIISTQRVGYDPLTNTIHWNPILGLAMRDGASTQSATLGLAHEMGHGALHLDDHIAYSYLTIENKALEEMDLLRLYEIPIASELGEPIRERYRDARGIREMNNPTHYRTMHYRPWWHFIAPWNWWKDREVITDHYLDCN